MRKTVFKLRGRGGEKGSETEDSSRPGEPVSPDELSFEDEPEEGDMNGAGGDGDRNSNDLEPEYGRKVPIVASEEEPSADESDAQSIDAEVISRLRAEAEENYDKYLRAVAELENFKKRSLKERSDLLRYAGEFLARDLLEVVDSLDLAAQQEVPEGAGELMNGIKLVRDRFLSILDKHSVKGKSAVGEQFNPQTHEAVASIPTADKPAGSIIEEYRKSYFFKDKLLRPGQVVVAVEPPVAKESDESEESTDKD